MHGGIRYLEYAQIGMVRESVRERETLLRIAPHLVHPLEFTWPVYRKARISRLKLRLGIGVYNILAGHPSVPRIRSSAGVLTREPLLNADGLKGGAVYTDATDTWTDEAPDEVRPSEKDIEYLLRAANAYFPHASVTEGDMVSAWAGIRPLADWDPAKNPSEFSREHRIDRNGAGMITVSGGKLTTYRAMAAEIVDAVEEELGRKASKCTTADVELPGEERSERIAAMIGADPELAARVAPDLPYTMAELRYGVESEMALTLSDLLMRRTRVAFETRDHGLGAAAAAADTIARIAGWDKHRKQAQLDAYTDDVARVFTVDSM